MWRTSWWSRLIKSICFYMSNSLHKMVKCSQQFMKGLNFLTHYLLACLPCLFILISFSVKYCPIMSLYFIKNMEIFHISVYERTQCFCMGMSYRVNVSNTSCLDLLWKKMSPKQSIQYFFVFFCFPRFCQTIKGLQAIFGEKNTEKTFLLVKTCCILFESKFYIGFRIYTWHSVLQDLNEMV